MIDIFGYLCNHIDLFNPNILHPPPSPRAHALHGSRPTSTALAAPAAAVPAAVRRRTGGAKDNGARAPSTGIVHHGQVDQVARWSGGQVTWLGTLWFLMNSDGFLIVSWFFDVLMEV